MSTPTPDRRRQQFTRLVTLAWRLGCGCRLTVPQVAEMFGVTEDEAERLLDVLSEWVPVCEDKRGRWGKM